MPILNYTTNIDAWKSVYEIQQVLSKHGVTHFSIKNEGSMPVALSFTIDYGGMPLNFTLPCNYQGVLNCLKKDKKIPSTHKNSEKALKVSWRILKTWVEAQLAIVESELAPMEEVFMQYMIVNDLGETLSQKMLAGNGMKLLSN